VFRASPDWGTPDHFLPQPTELELKDSKTDPGCSNSVRRAALALLKWGLYVCPNGHREWSLARGCGYEKDFYCASWGCETSGDAYWSPTSACDYIHVKKGWKISHRNNTLMAECPNSLEVSFTEAGKKDFSGRLVRKV
jgi:hypothetical protein